MYYGGWPLNARKRTKKPEFTRHGTFEYRWWREIDNTEIPATAKYLQCGIWSAPAGRHNALDKANTETKTLTHKSYGTDYLFIFVRWTCAKGRKQQRNESQRRIKIRRRQEVINFRDKGISWRRKRVSTGRSWELPGWHKLIQENKGQ